MGSVLLLGLILHSATSAADASGSTNAPVDFSIPADPVFSNALAVVSQQRVFRAVACDSILGEWRTNLSLLLGMRIDIGSSRFVNLIELTTLPLDPAARTNQAKPPATATLNFTCPKNDLISTSRVYRSTSLLYPVRVRVYDGSGHFLRESRESLAWSFLTNGITQACVLMSAATNAAASVLTGIPPPIGSAAQTNPAAIADAIAFQLKLERATMASLATLFGLFSDTLGASSLEEVRQHAFGVVRSPNILKVITSLGLSLDLHPEFDQAVVLPANGDDEPRAWLPVELVQGKRLLLSVAFVAGSTKGPHFLTGGVRAIRAVHPTKPDHWLLAQVLTVGETTLDPTPAKAGPEQRPRPTVPKGRSPK